MINILSAPPGYGKSFVAAQMPGVKVSADDYFYRLGYFDPNKLGQAHGECLLSYTTLLLNGEDEIVVDNTNTTGAEIAPYYALAEAFGRDVQIVRVMADREVAWSRQLHDVPRKVFDQMVDRWLRREGWVSRWQVVTHRA